MLVVGVLVGDRRVFSAKASLHLKTFIPRARESEMTCIHAIGTDLANILLLLDQPHFHQPTYVQQILIKSHV